MRRVQIVAVVLLLAVLVSASVLLGRHAAWARGQTDGAYNLTWWTVDGGGRSDDHTAGGYALSGTVGQPDAALWQGGDYALSGGFWPGSPPAGGKEFGIYLPVLLR